MDLRPYYTGGAVTVPWHSEPDGDLPFVGPSEYVEFDGGTFIRTGQYLEQVVERGDGVAVHRW